MLRYFTLITLAMLLAVPTARAQESLPWEALTEPEHVKTADGQWTIRYGPTLRRLGGQQVQIKGFIVPAQGARSQERFLLTKTPVKGCPYCASGREAAVIEVQARAPVAFTYDPVTITGRLELLRGSGAYFGRLVEARQVRTAGRGGWLLAALIGAGLAGVLAALVKARGARPA